MAKFDRLIPLLVYEDISATHARIDGEPVDQPYGQREVRRA